MRLVFPARGSEELEVVARRHKHVLRLPSLVMRDPNIDSNLRTPIDLRVFALLAKTVLAHMRICNAAEPLKMGEIRYALINKVFEE